MARRPNLLLVHSDQHRWDCLGLRGAGRVRTPRLDALAGGGVDFTHAFTPNPVCSPARACLQTGAWSTTHGCLSIVGTETYRPADPALPTLTGLLAGAGYRVGHVGKFHGEVVGGPTDHGAEVYVSAGEYGKWRASRGLPPRPRVNGLFGEVDPHVTTDQTALAWQGDRALAILHDFADSADEKPFLLRFDPPEPHLPNVVSPEMAGWYPPESIDPWPGFPDDLAGKPEAQRRTRQRWGTDGWPWEQWRPIVSRYLAEVELLDRQVGRLLDALDARGLAGDTLVVYTTDHGDMCGAHGMVDKHFVAYDDVMRVPLIARWPGRLPAGATFDGFVHHELDLARTLLAAAGVDAPPSFAGRDLVADVAAGEGRDFAFAQYHGTHQGLYSIRMLRTRRWKYAYNPVAVDELYDLDADPGELNNLAADPARAGVLADLRTRMADFMREIGDPLSPPTFDWGRSKLPPDHPAYSPDAASTAAR